MSATEGGAAGGTAAEGAAPAVPGPWERKRIRTSLEIEVVGLELVATHGLDEVTVDQVAQRAGISNRTYFRYFRNVADVLTGLPTRETDRVVDHVIARPADEGVIEAFQAVWHAAATGGQLPEDNRDLREATGYWWGVALRREPAAVATASRALEIMGSGYERAVRARLGAGDDDARPGLIAAALAGVIWFTYRQWLEGDGERPLPAALEQSFEDVSAFFGEGGRLMIETTDTRRERT